MFKVKATDIPKTDFLASKSEFPYFRDALLAPLTNKDLTPSNIQLNIFSHMPTWVNKLMRLRNGVVKRLGFRVDDDLFKVNVDQLKVGDKAGFMTVIRCNDIEIVSFAEDRHMDFYMAVTKKDDKVVISTLVNKKTTVGRVYLTMIAPFHWFIARTVITNAINKGRI